VTPDLQTEIWSDELTRERAAEISEASESVLDGLRVWNAIELHLFHRKPFLQIPELHDYLTDSADWNAATWDFELDGRRRLARTLGWLYEMLPEAFRFSATWGPVSIDERNVDRDELLVIVEDNLISTGTVYNVRAVG
jgi:hypothetical protein